MGVFVCGETKGNESTAREDDHTGPGGMAQVDERRFEYFLNILTAANSFTGNGQCITAPGMNECLGCLEKQSTR